MTSKNPYADLPKKYLITNFEEYVLTAKLSYKKGDIIEAFIFLYSILEMELLTSWALFLYAILKRPVTPSKTNWKYRDLVDLLYEIQMINKTERSIFLKFKKGRDNAVHHLASPRKANLTTKSLNDQFQNGLKAHKIIQTTISRIFEKHSKLFGKKKKV